MTHVKYYFCLNADLESQEVGRFFRVHTRFSYVTGYVRETVQENHLACAARNYRLLSKISENRGRLYQALALNVAGCWSHPWHVAFICHSAAAEGLLTYDTGGGITRRLATAFACLTHRSDKARDVAFRRFSDLYSTRSDINHGRVHLIPRGRKLQLLAQLERAVRDAWRSVLNSATKRAALEGSDTVRKQFFTSLQGSYEPPRDDRSTTR